MYAFKIGKILVYDPIMCKTPDALLQDELLCWTSVVYGYFYFMQICHAILDES